MDEYMRAVIVGVPDGLLGPVRHRLNGAQFGDLPSSKAAGLINELASLLLAKGAFGILLFGGLAALVDITLPQPAKGVALLFCLAAAIWAPAQMIVIGSLCACLARGPGSNAPLRQRYVISRLLLASPYLAIMLAVAAALSLLLSAR